MAAKGSRTELVERLTANMAQLKELSTIVQGFDFGAFGHIPDSAVLPLVDIKIEQNSIDDDCRELQLLKDLILSDNVNVISELSKLRRVEYHNKEDLIKDYMYNSNKYSSFRLNKRMNISYRNGYYYDIDEDMSTIINYSCEVTPAIYAKLKMVTSTQLTNHHVSNSINVLAFGQLDPDFVSIYVPNQ
ncbi:hypothetical protein HgNV_058 [Homarus gammarus nudivirus]|uniref:Uncharacterized protein n=1 Tax=Homarus gammarus nudivirus TaxID=2509616 RepID=A0A411HBB8_9VIRU|nr:hypothetical protein KM727_gp58 [Homarus gammarus nudivirus]QBB28663.1 hypothetical protein HgNV_058 [Homarus gammarus nudivirus]